MKIGNKSVGIQVNYFEVVVLFYAKVEYVLLTRTIYEKYVLPVRIRSKIVLYFNILIKSNT